MLYMLGSVAWETAPLNVDEVGHQTGADFAEKPILGRAPSYEFMGVTAEEITFKGKLFPRKLGGLDDFDQLQEIRAGGAAEHLMRGDGRAMGWFNITAISSTARYLAADGVGQIIEFEMTLRQGDKPPAGEYQGSQLGLVT
jgi:hypothetical protein